MEQAVDSHSSVNKFQIHLPSGIGAQKQKKVFYRIIKDMNVKALKDNSTS